MEKIWNVMLTAMFLYVVAAVSFQLISGGGDNGSAMASHLIAIVVVAISFWRSLHDGKAGDKVSKAIYGVNSQIEALNEALIELPESLHHLDRTAGEIRDYLKQRDLLAIDIEIAKLSGDAKRLERLRSDRQPTSKAA